tara:strand:+ start:482 stop:1009 length:528 start_codon:yes stop_codon:yes gene_type:complete
MNNYASMMSGGKKTKKRKKKRKTRKKRKIQYGGVKNEEWLNIKDFYKHVKDLEKEGYQPKEVRVKDNDINNGNAKIEIFFSAVGEIDYFTLTFHDKKDPAEDPAKVIMTHDYVYDDDDKNEQPNMSFQTKSFVTKVNGGQKKTKKRKRRRKLKKKRKSKKKRKTRKKKRKTKKKK